MENNFKYKTIVSPVQGDYRDRGSKFLAYAYPLNSIADFKEILNTVKKEHSKASHHCFAYRIGNDGTCFRANDDGEPAGSAGKPILGQIDSLGFTNLCVIVVRYFGGTLLGVPGLINAYKTACFNALQNAQVIEKWVEDIYNLDFDYPMLGEILHIIKQNEGQVYTQDLQLFCKILVGIPIPKSTQFYNKLFDIKGITISKKV